MDAKLTQKIQRLIQPEVLKKREPLLWSPGLGTDVWAMFCACITGDLEAVMRLVNQDPSLARSHYEYRTPLSFAVRENHVEVAAYLLDHGAEPFGVGGDLLKVARDRGYAEMERMLASKYHRIYGASAEGETLAAAIRKRDPETVRHAVSQVDAAFLDFSLAPSNVAGTSSARNESWYQTGICER